MYSPKKGGISPLVFIGVGVTLVLAIIGVGVFVVAPHLASHAADPAVPNPNCTVIVPPNPLTATGLATPYQLVATDPAAGPCNEANANQSAFVQAVILDPATGALSSYEPLVIDQGTQPAIAPVMPTLPANAVVGIWFGDNGTALTLKKNAQLGGKAKAAQMQRTRKTLRGATNGNCVNGTANSPFGQFAYCNAPNFFQAANKLIAAGKITIPALGVSPINKQACPTTRDFAIVDMDQSDNVQTQYLANAQGQIAQLNVDNQAKLAGATTLGNPSDNALVTKILDPALGCTPFTITDQVNPTVPTATLATDELAAAANQAANPQTPFALIPAGDPMVLINAAQSLTKTNLYRIGVDQKPVAALDNANTTTYCTNLVNISLPRLNLDKAMANFANLPSPDGGATANSLFTFLANRMNATFADGGLNCVGLLKIQNPITLTTNNGIVTDATVVTTPLPATAAGTTTGTGTTTTTTNTATGTVNAILDTNAGTAQVSPNINIANFANQQFFVNVTDSATGTQLLHQAENTDANGASAATTTINNLQGLTAIPATWVASITDANGNALGSANFVSNGATAVATLAATTTTTTPGTTTTTTPAKNNKGKGKGKHGKN